MKTLFLRLAVCVGLLIWGGFVTEAAAQFDLDCGGTSCGSGTAGDDGAATVGTTDGSADFGPIGRPPTLNTFSGNANLRFDVRVDPCTVVT
ncbi:MAG: hypothetical protein ACRD1T_23005, partial [Acidimicrobiia bacterium]